MVTSPGRGAWPQVLSGSQDSNINLLACGDHFLCIWPARSRAGLNGGHWGCRETLGLLPFHCRGLPGSCSLLGAMTVHGRSWLAV